jgi:hypothetical protein
VRRPAGPPGVGPSRRRNSDHLALLDAYHAYRDAEFTRLCEVQRQLMGNLHKYRPAD